MKIIVNADDFGVDEVCTLAICESFRKGLLSQTTTMVNMPWFEKGVELAKVNGFFAKVGLHFNLTEGLALTQAMRECQFFCDEQGMFTGDFHRSLKTRLLIPKSAESALKQEAAAQIEKYLAVGYDMMHLDSHHHVHTDFAVARVLFPVAKQYGFKTCRISRTISHEKMGLVKRVYKAVFNRYLAKYFQPITNEFTDFEDFRNYCRKINATATVEVMMHPGAESDCDISDQLEFWEHMAQQGLKPSK